VSSPFRRTKAESESVAVPKDVFVILQGESDGLPDIWVINQALDRPGLKAAFPWHLSIIIEMEAYLKSGLPTEPEQEVLSRFADELRTHLETDGNAAFLASITWDGTRQLMFRVQDPERANAYLTTVVENESPVRQLEYQMEEDPAWELADPCLAPARNVAKDRGLA
jgi:Family of unknown function (DUF695)